MSEPRVNGYRPRHGFATVPPACQPTEWTQCLSAGLVCWAVFGLIPLLFQAIKVVSGDSLGELLVPWTAMVLWVCLLRAACGLNLVLLPATSSLWIVTPCCVLQAGLFGVGFGLGFFAYRGSAMPDWLGVPAGSQIYLAQWCLVEIAVSLLMAYLALSARLRYGRLRVLPATRTSSR